MQISTDDGADVPSELHLSRRIALLHVAGLALLILVVVSSMLWAAVEQNRLARRTSEQLVASAVAALGHKVEYLVRDYSVWNEAHHAIHAGDRDWLYRNIGSAAAQIGTLDLIQLTDPQGGPAFGWRAGSPPEGETGLLPPAVADAVLGRVDRHGAGRVLFAPLDGDVWAFSAAEVRPVDGALADRADAEPALQIHGLRLTQDRLSVLTESLPIVGGVALAAAPRPDQASLALYGETGAPVAFLVWAPPRPGSLTLRRVGPPLGAALALAAVAGLISSRIAVRSARRLQSALDRARQADRKKSEFLSNVTHELRTPMNGVMGATQLLEMTALDAEQRELVGVLEASARAQMALIGDLLDYARIESGQRTLVEAPFVPVQVLSEIGAMVRASVAADGLTFETDWSGLDGLAVRGDGRAFRQIATNLLGNAVKFTPEGSVHARAGSTAVGDRVEITLEVSDTGVGIPETEMERIFERFYRIDGAMARATDGAGLGLAISARLAALMGGKIEVESLLGEGSTFRFVVGLPSIEGVAHAG